jgi:alkanesulfonate monooxygenase SsuD/methylene tetrahydromethanopterin reductase-like flavin-dependent oxidoreductase (luciferase family)
VSLSAALSKVSALIPGNYDDADPGAGLERTLQVFEWAEAQGYAGAWVRQRHLERGVSSSATFLAAATQRTRRVDLGVGVIPLGYENPFRLAEDLATVDVLSGGRLNVGVSAGQTPFAPLLGDLFLPHQQQGEEPVHRQAERLARALRSEPLSQDAVAGNAAGAQIPRVRPHAKGLTERLWYGGGSLKSAEWAGRNGFGWLTGNIATGEETDVFLVAQKRLIETYLAHWSGQERPQVALGRVILPTDSADAATRRRYRDFAASRHARTLAPQGPRRTLFLPDIVGSVDEILDILARDPVLPLATSFRLELPYELAHEDYLQILADFSRVFRSNHPQRDNVDKGAGQWLESTAV